MISHGLVEEEEEEEGYPAAGDEKRYSDNLNLFLIREVYFSTLVQFGSG